MRRISYGDMKQNVSKLPRLPIPDIDDTLTRYINAIMPFKRQKNITDLIRKAEIFRKGSAGRLQQILVDTDASRDGYPFSYIEKHWDDMYLKDRSPLVINTNPAFGFKPIGALETNFLNMDKRANTHRIVSATELSERKGNTVDVKQFKTLSQAETAAHFVFSVVKYMQNIINNGIEIPEDKPFDVSQVPDQFCISRTPFPNRDVKSRNNWVPCDDTAGVHSVTVLHDGHIYLVKVFDPDSGKAVAINVLTDAFNHILQATPSDDNTAPVTALTGLPRDDWANFRAELIKCPDNKALLRSIDQSIIVVSLDTENWETHLSKQRNMLYGGSQEYENRWYDKHQVIISADSQVAVNFEHSFSDGITWSHWCNAVYSDMQHTVLTEANSGAPEEGIVKANFKPLPSIQTISSVVGSSLVKPVHIMFGKSFSANIREAKATIKTVGDNLGLECAIIPIGKNDIKVLKCSPDAFFQLCLHLAFFKITDQQLAPTYESCSTNSFFHGRTETIRSATNEVRAFLDLYRKKLDPTAPPTNVAIEAAMREMMSTHVAVAKLAAQGQGIDRHLTALNHIVTSEAGAASVKNAQSYMANNLLKRGVSHSEVRSSDEKGCKQMPSNSSPHITPDFSTNVDDALDFFCDPYYQKLNSWTMSTSNISQPFIDSFAFGPTSQKGYGIGYIIQDYQIVVCLSNFNGNMTSAQEMKMALLESSVELYDILRCGNIGSDVGK
eukprot:Tbor_TRINITY_DN2877_c0_g1::TRINITY_DN2877_c0_g1_i1::g.23172::m.23172/K08766/CPT2; carnitine O-palmitoyltransferase 2